MDLDEHWMNFFQAALVHIQEKNDPKQALTFAWQLYLSGEKYYSELEEEDTALNIYRHCSILLNLINETGQHDPVLETKCFYREKLLSSDPIDPTRVWIPFLSDRDIILAKKLRLLRDIRTMIDEYSDVEHINVWPSWLEIKISYENLLGFYRGQPSSIELINRERIKYFIQSGWKLLEKNPAKLVCRMCQSIRSNFDQLPDTDSLEFLKLWATALEKVGNIELAIKKAEEANDKDLVARLKQELEDFRSDSEPDEDWIRGTLAEQVTKSLEQAKGREKPKEKKRRSRPKRKQNDEHLDNSTTVHSVIADVTNHITNWKDVTEFDLPVYKPRKKRSSCQIKIQQQEGDPPVSRSKVARSNNTTAAIAEDEFDQLPPELPVGYSSVDESSSDDDSLSINETEQNVEPPNDKTFYEDSCKVYNTQGQSKNIDDYLLTNGLDLSDKCVSELTVKAKNIYDEMRNQNECLDLCKKFPKKYKLCRIEIINSHKAVCRTVNENIEIEISGRSKCGKVFNQDEVVVELFEPEKNTSKSQRQSAEDDKVYGKVICQIKTNENRPKHPVLVCTLDLYLMYHMRPLCKTVPKIHILAKHRERESQVVIYKYTKQTKKLTFDRLKTIDQSKRGEYLFLVCFISWNGMYPLGAVIGVYDGNRDIQTSIRLVCLRNNVSVLYRENTVRETEKILSSKKSDQNNEQHRKDYSDSLLRVFTIDGNDTKDLDDAISVQIISENDIIVGVHISDVGSIIKKDDSIDVEAKERSTTYYPGGGCPPYHMLPEPIGTDMCSLLPDQKRKALSIFYRFDDHGKLLGYEIESTFIKSRRRLTYCKAQEIISSDDENTELKKELCLLQGISKILRSKRLGNKVFSFPFEEPHKVSSESYFQSLDAHHIVEELMILSNKTVGQDLIKTFPDCIPLRVQPAPSTCKIRDWLQQYPVIGQFVLSLQHQSLPTDEKLSFEKALVDQKSEQLPIQKYIWKKIESSFKMEDYKTVQRWIGTDQYHPQQAMAYESWISFQETSYYQCSGASHDKTHFSLGIYPYLHFTSPIRRYADLIVNRLVHAMLDKKKSPYTKKEMEIICRKINNQSRAFQKQCRLLHLARQLKQQPIMLHGLISSASDNVMFLCFPGLKELSNSSGQIQFSSLKLKSKPHIEESNDTKLLFTLSWIQRLYSPYAYGSYSGSSVSRREPVKLDPHQRVIFLSLQKWKILLDHLINENIESLEVEYFERETLVKCRECEGTHIDVTSESKDGITKLQSEFSLTFSKGQVIPVQIGYEKKEGLPVPKIQMLALTNNVKCCIQHMTDPVKCFAVYANIHAGNRRMTSSEYIQRWLKIFRMESATNAAKSTSIIINDLHVKFQGADRYDGSFVLHKTFCMERDIYIDYASNDGQNDDKERIISYQTDFLCIRCEMVKGVPSKPKAACPPNERWIWIGHGETKCFQIGKENENIKVHFNLHKDAFNPTASMIDNSAKDNLTCTVEILPMADADKHREKAIARLEKATPLARSIALREKCPLLDETHSRLAMQTRYDVKSNDMQPNNKKQLEAIKQALTSSFSLIQGPPGTGKTLTGIKLIILFNQINLKIREDGGEHKQVVYCGPSNKSVDLVARWMKFNIPDLCPKIVRMYGISMENMIYPIPNREYINQSSCKDNRPDSDLADISLHNLIRQKEKPYAEKLAMFEKQFKNAPEEIATEDILKYKMAVIAATKEELKHYDVIFCTTAAALSPKFLSATDGKIFQLIIDEAGMCTEPETLAPIIATKAEQVVLIGDHQQLQPIILCPEASDLGLSKSLFERYADNAVFLDTQYRMNPKICEFPSKQFYKGKLETGPTGKWNTVERPLQIWQRPDVPLLFCHIEGKEECLAVTTEEGNQQSRSNRAEVDHVVKVYEYLMSHDKMERHHVKVMSQYNAQCSAIRDALKKKGFINSNVTTAVSSQGGEWDYVIFSAVRSLPKFRIESNHNKGWCKKNLGFITDAHQINVVLTRARKGIIIIGNRNLLKCDNTWEALIKHYTSLGCMVDAEDQNLTPLKRPGRRY